MRFNHLAKLSGALILTAGLTGVSSAQSYNSSYNGYSAHEACKSDENRGKLIGGGLGAVAGAVLGSQVAGNGARTEASVLGGVLGGLAGAGIADKRVDCDPVYNPEGYQTSSTTRSYGSEPSYSTTSSGGYHQTAGYQHVDYGTRTTVSDHPVYQNPTWGAQPARTYTSQTVSQPVYSQPTYQQATYSQPTYSQPTYSSSTTRYVSAAPTTTYVRPATTSYVRPATTTYSLPTTYVRPSHTERRHSLNPGGYHHHGKYSCSSHH